MTRPDWARVEAEGRYRPRDDYPGVVFFHNEGRLHTALRAADISGAMLQKDVLRIIMRNGVEHLFDRGTVGNVEYVAEMMAEGDR